MTALADELTRLEHKALKAAEALEAALEALSDFHWAGQEDSPLFQVNKGTLEVLEEIEVRLAAPISEIQCAA